MKTLAFAIIAAAAIAKGEPTIALVSFIATCVESFFDDSIRIVFNNIVKAKEGGDHA